MFLASFTLSKQDLWWLAVGLICIGPLAVNLGYVIWLVLAKPRLGENTPNYVRGHKCSECGHIEVDNQDNCPRCGAWLKQARKKLV